ncbi:hypothetical protein SAMN05421505_10162 [Sinosporangium album]|uniref:Peptidase inhibitor family I36 n=1 Tax=Sinosporangium album TaxID=504805 RepID=A0A1G7QNR9_9ACTN|nr:hypothetical protein [Sinosporangium album]SDG00152.1 hypothetical protein SAMN05421505_10162 [Sinosporangium album]
MRKALATLGAAMLLAAGSATAAAASPSAPDAARPCGGPHRVGNDAVWYNCSNANQRICVRQYIPYPNYVAVVAPGGEHRNSWRWTNDMSTSMTHCN